MKTSNAIVLTGALSLLGLGLSRGLSQKLSKISKAARSLQISVSRIGKITLGGGSLSTDLSLEIKNPSDQRLAFYLEKIHALDADKKHLGTGIPQTKLVNLLPGFTYISTQIVIPLSNFDKVRNVVEELQSFLQGKSPLKHYTLVLEYQIAGKTYHLPIPVKNLLDT